MRIGMDFDGTLAVWPRGCRVDYNDVEWCLANSCAVPAAVRWLKRVIKSGNTVVVITGRGHEHAASLRYWLHEFTAEQMTIVTRPPSVGLNSEAQAKWKCHELRKHGIDVYVGDNHAIDGEAARAAGVRFLDASMFRRGKMPPTPSTAT